MNTPDIFKIPDLRDTKKIRKPMERKAKKVKIGGDDSLPSTSDSETHIDWFSVNNIKDDYNSIKVVYDGHNVLAPLNFDNLVKYVIECKGKRKIIEFTEKFTNDVPGRITFFEIAVNLLKVKYNVNRLKTLTKRLKKGVDSGAWPSKAPAAPAAD